MSILIITDRESDLSRILMHSAPCRQVSFSQAGTDNLSDYSAIALLCGTNGGVPFVLPAAPRLKIDAFAESGKPIFYEWCGSLGCSHTVGNDYTDGRESSNDAMGRYVYLGGDADGLASGDLLDSQANTGCIYDYIPKGAVPILYNGGHILKHDHIDPAEIETDKIPAQSWRQVL